MDSTGDELLRLILQNRQDDLPRLIYADWLDERFRLLNDPVLEARAEFIRLQIALEAGKIDQLERQAFRRELHLRQTYGALWAGELLNQAADWNFKRGFIHHLQMDARRFLDLHEELAFNHPLEHLHLFWGMETPRERADDLRRVASVDLLRNLYSIDLSGAGVGSDGVANLAASSQIEKLRELVLPGTRIGSRGLKAILEAPWFGTLEKIDLADNEIDLKAVRILHDHFARIRSHGEIPVLERIDLRGNPLRVAGVRLLSRTPNLARLVRW